VALSSRLDFGHDARTCWHGWGSLRRGAADDDFARITNAGREIAPDEGTDGRVKVKATKVIVEVTLGNEAMQARS